MLRRLSREHWPTNFFEVLHEVSPRSLYFDLDGRSEHRDREDEIVSTLTKYIEKDLGLENLCPVVLRNNDKAKFSCHVVYPEIQFTDHQHQSQYVPRMLHYMYDFAPILGEVVDTVPYSKFQLLRAPWAAKLTKDMRLERETMFIPPAIP